MEPTKESLSRTGVELVEIERFAQALRQAMAVNGLSERRLAAALGITIGTTLKYFRGLVHPMKVATGINHRLAALLGTSTDSLVAFYETGAYESELSLANVVKWLRSNVEQEHLAVIVQALAEVGNRKPLASERYDWPKQALEDEGISVALRQRMGLSDEALERLATTGEFDDELVEAFSVATNFEEDAVREAFMARRPVV